MPYGFAKKLGGDTPATDAKMEACVARVQAEGHDKSSAIAICKFSIARSMRKKKHA